MKVIAKIENMQGIQNLEEILSVSGWDYGSQRGHGRRIPLEEVPVLQKKMIKWRKSRENMLLRQRRCWNP